jgi:hypothetical protein
VILTVHMKSGRQIAITNPTDSLATYLDGDVGGSNRHRTRQAIVGRDCDRIYVTGSTQRQHSTAEIRLATEEIEFVQVDVPISEVEPQSYSHARTKGTA